LLVLTNLPKSSIITMRKIPFMMMIGLSLRIAFQSTEF